jgi:hypothetical protein
MGFFVKAGQNIVGDFRIKEKNSSLKTSAQAQKVTV